MIKILRKDTPHDILIISTMYSMCTMEMSLIKFMRLINPKFWGLELAPKTTLLTKFGDHSFRESLNTVICLQELDNVNIPL